ncbi:helix-turn-helix domain-containing protein [Nocardia farcinica]|uniref:helix-turn-helix domain-containing protein n=1 Tax=Nocardia farcinica TaxID=37329 RepID=UPI001895086C|nr:helix-turn-helix domain-containing protein [Nocardia farcinica]MBF6410929.1 helix-turn-helix domain-containing protein [Nocardia farcinica]
MTLDTLTREEFARSRLTRPNRKVRDYERATIYRDTPAYIPSAPTTAHVRFLHDELGLPLLSIARDSGVSSAGLKKIHRGVSPKISTRHAAALQAVSFHPNYRQETVLAIGAIRRLRALRMIGWPCPVLAERMAEWAPQPVSSGLLMQLTTRPPTLMTWEMWQATSILYERLSGTPGGSVRARYAAARYRWPAPLDWEGHDINDPRVTVTASGPPAPPTRAQLVAERRIRCAELDARGLSNQEIAEQLGVTARTVERIKAELRQHTT